MHNISEQAQPSASATEMDKKLADIFRQNALGYGRSRSVNLTMLVQFGEIALLTRIQDGQVTAVEDLRQLRPLASFDFSVKASSQSWLAFWAAVPKAGSHDIFALSRHGQMQIQGNLHPLMSNLQFIKDLLAIGRGSV